MAALRFFFYLLMKPAAIGMAFLGLIGVFAPYINPEQWWVPAFSGLFMPIILIVNFFLLVFWAFHKKIWAVLPLVTILANYYFFSSMYQWPWKKLPSCSPGKELIVGSYNVEGFYWIAKDPVKNNIKKFVEENHIDILCVQEHCEESHLDSATIIKRMGFPYRSTFFNRQTEWANFGISIYSRYPILRQGNINFNSEQNSSMWVDILIDKDTIRIFNNHLQKTDINPNRKQYDQYKSVKNWHGQARILVNILEQLKHNFQIRAQQAKVVRHLIDTTHYPTIICGDFNDTPISYTYNRIIKNDFTDSFQCCGKGYGHSFNGLKGLLRIDFIAFSSNFCGYSYDSPRLPWSDHNPVLVKLVLEK